MKTDGVIQVQGRAAARRAGAHFRRAQSSTDEAGIEHQHTIAATAQVSVRVDGQMSPSSENEQQDSGAHPDHVGTNTVGDGMHHHHHFRHNHKGVTGTRKDNALKDAERNEEELLKRKNHLLAQRCRARASACGRRAKRAGGWEWRGGALRMLSISFARVPLVYDGGI